MKRCCWIVILVLVLGCPGKRGEEDTSSIESSEKKQAKVASANHGVAPGVVVEKVPEISALGKAGIRAGDVLLSWKRPANPPANPELAEGTLESPFDFHNLRIEQTPRGVVEISGQRKKVDKTWIVEPGSWTNVAAQPRWIGEYGRLYHLGRLYIENQAFADGITAWLELSDQLSHERRHLCWVRFELAQFWLITGHEHPSATESFAKLETSLNAQAVNRLDLAYIKQELGFIFERRGSLNRARDFYNHALEIRQQVSPRSLSTAYSLSDLGDIAYQYGALDEAQKFYRSAIEIREDLAPESLKLASSLNNLGNLVRTRGRLSQARELFTRALEINTRLNPESLQVAANMNNLGTVEAHLGNLNKSKALNTHALSIQENLAPGSLGVAISLLNLGNVAEGLGDLDQAQELFEQALRIQEALAPESTGTAKTLNNLGAIARNRGHLDTAHQFSMRALRILEKESPESPNVSDILNNLGNVAYARGDLAQAHHLFTRALRAAKQIEPESSRVSNILNNLGVVALDDGNLVIAKNYFQEALTIQEQESPDNFMVGRILNNIGSVAERQGHLEEAQRFFIRALRVGQEGAPGSLYVATALSNLGFLASNQKNWAQAHSLYHHALQIRQRLAPQSLDTADTLNSLGALALAKGDLKQAASHNLQAITVLEQQTRNLGGSYSREASFRDQQRKYYSDTLNLFMSEEDYPQAFHISERFRARTFLTMLAEKPIAFKSDLPIKLVQKRRNLAVRHHTALKELSLLSNQVEKERAAIIHRDLEAMSHERAEIEGLIRQASPQLATLQYPKPLTTEAAQDVLDSGTLLVSYVVGEKSTSIFALSQQEALEAKVVPMGEAALREKVEHLREFIPGAIPDTQLGHGRTQSFQTLNRKLYKLLLEPLADRIEKSHRLLILPDGPLHALPFAALLHEDEYLVEWKPLHIALSMTAYAELKKTRPDEQETAFQLAAFGDPYYPKGLTLSITEGRFTTLPQDAVLRSVSMRDGFEWRAVPYTRREVEGIATLFPKTQVFLGLEALEERIKNLSPGVRILHLAAHAFTDDQIPLNSFVALTIPEDLPEGRDNGLLQAWEILEQVRIDADLVVLSGCLTGMGKELRGEGLIGLTRAFQYAGARSMMSTLWNVDDQAQSELMIRFYRHLRSGLAKDEALRAAQLEFLREPIMSVDENGEPMELEYASAPFYWAGVQLYGDWM